MGAVNIYATSNDMLEVCQEFETKFDFRYAYIESTGSSQVIVMQSAAQIDGFWTSPSGFVGRTVLLIPPGPDPVPREVNVRAGGKNYHLQPSDVDVCVALQEGGVFKQEDCLIAGRMTNTKADDWSKSKFGSMSQLLKERFEKVKSYYLGNEAASLWRDGYRLTFQASAPREVDLSEAD